MPQWLEDIRWAVSLMRARRHRRSLYFSGRMQFDDFLRPKIEGEPGRVIAYPDAFYRITAEDVRRAIGGDCAHEWIDIRNKHVQSGSMCRKCNALRAENVD